MSSINRYYYLEKKRRGRSIAKEAHISEVLITFLKKCHIDYNPYEEKIITLFKELCGQIIVKFITDIRLKNNILYIFLIM